MCKCKSSTRYDCCKCEKESSGALLKTNFVKDNAIFQNELGNTASPPDTIMAIGPTVAIAMVNELIGYFERPSMTRVNLETMRTFFPFGSTGGGFDVQIIYDEFSSRFFALAWQNPTVSATLTITSPTSVAGVYDARKMVNSAVTAFPVTNEIVPTDPIDAYDPVTGTWALTPASQAAVNGKIALVKRRSITFPLGPGNNAVNVATVVRNAGAVGLILYDDVDQPIPNFGGLNVTPSFPQIAISKADGEKLAAAYGAYPPFPTTSPLNGTMAVLSSAITKNYMNIAVSKTSSPLSTNDWYKYQFTTNYWLTFGGLADYPKIAVNETNFYIATQDRLDVDFRGTVSVLKKSDLVNNTAQFYIDENSSTFISQNTAVMSMNNPNPARIVYSCYKNFLPQFFLNLNFGLDAFGELSIPPTGIRVFIGPSLSSYITVLYPVPTVSNPLAPAVQPLSSTGAISAGLDPRTLFVLSAVIYKHSIFAVQTVWIENRQVVRWYELDVSRAASYGQITIKQWGDIDTCQPNESCFVPAINVDKCGNVGVAFTISGPNTLPTFAYTGRLRSDPPGTMRKPFQTIKVSPYPYNGGNQTIRYFQNPPTLLNRWEDYKALVIDPNDGKTFFAFGENSADDKPPALPNDVDAQGRSLKWTTTMASFNIKKCKKGNTVVAEPCPAAPQNQVDINSETVFEVADTDNEITNWNYEVNSDKEVSV